MNTHYRNINLSRFLCGLILCGVLGAQPSFAVDDDSSYDTEAAWSKDGSRIYFYTYRHGASEIYWMKPDGSEQTRVTDSVYNEWWPEITGDENRLVITSDRDSGGAFDGSNLYLLDVRSKKLKRLTNVEEGQWAIGATVAPKAEIVLYQVSDGFPNIESIESAELWQLDLKTKKAALYPDDPEHRNFSPTISSDGSMVAYSSVRDGNRGLYLNDRTGGNEKLLLAVTGTIGSATFSPNGEWVAFSAGNALRAVDDKGASINEAEIFVARTDGSEIRRLTASVGSDHAPSWSPDGRTIIFSSYRYGPSDIFAISLDGTDERNLTKTSGD